MDYPLYLIPLLKVQYLMLRSAVTDAPLRSKYTFRYNEKN